MDTRLTQATGTAVHEAALEMLAELPGEQRNTIAVDKNFDTSGFVSGCRQLDVVPHVTQNTYEYSTKAEKRVQRKNRIGYL